MGTLNWKMVNSFPSPCIEQRLTSNAKTDVYRFMANETQSVMFGVDYRLAPEHVFPVPHDDSYEALNHVIANADKYGIDTMRIALWGASAGGNLAAGVALRDAHEHDQTRICHVSLVAPPLCPPSLAPAVLSVPSASYPHFTSQGNPLVLTNAQELWGTLGRCSLQCHPRVDAA